MGLQQNSAGFTHERTDSFVPSGNFVGYRPSIEALTDAYAAISALGPKSRIMIPPSVLVQFGEWLDWPAWFKNGTTLAPGPGLPERISVAEDLILIANVVDHGYDQELLSRLSGATKIAGSLLVAPALYHAPSLYDALMLAKRSTEANTPYMKLHFQIDDDQFTLVIDSEIKHGPLLEFAATAYLCTFQRFIGFFRPEFTSEVEFRTKAQADRKASTFLQDLPGTKQFDADIYSINGKAEWLKARNGQTDPAFWNLALERVGQMERDCNRSDIVDRIRAIIRKTMETENRVPRLKQVAASERVSERTLVRTLAAQGTNFHKIVEEERRLIAAELIGKPSISLAEIAKSLGFTDMSSFGRSFKQWYGMTPGQARLWRMG